MPGNANNLGFSKHFFKYSQTKNSTVGKKITDLILEGFIQFERLPHNLKANKYNLSY